MVTKTSGLSPLRNLFARRLSTSAAVAVALFLGSGCAASDAATRDDDNATADTAPPAAGETDQTAEAPPAIVDDGIPLATDDPPRFDGVVTETLDSGGYTYVRVKRDDGHAIWTAVGAQKVAVGDRLTIQRSVVMHDFHSKTLGHTF